ncbi:MAG: hypothetical protein R2681_07660 [Pyrinomonadaceae bacterium]
MKTCPQCRSNYTDDTLQFCLQDGTLLEQGDADPSQMKTVSFEENATVIAKKPREKITFDLDTPAETAQHAGHTHQSFSSNSEPPRANTFLVVLVTIFAMLIVFGIIGAGAWYLLREKPQAVKNSNEPAVNEGRRGNLIEDDLKISPTPAKDKDDRNTPEPAKTPSYDREKLIGGVGKQISSWKSLAESRDLEGYMKKYGSKINYYSKRGASREFVKSDKKKAFETFTSIRTKLSSITITPAPDGKRATAVFDKEWDFSGPDKRSSGKVQTQLIFEKSGEDWLIVSERDLKVYYVNK